MFHITDRQPVKNFVQVMVADRILNVLDARSPKNLTGDHYKPAAVLMPIQERDDGDHLVLTKRAEHLNHHRVRWPFRRPVDAGDRNGGSSLRESHEEIGIDPSHVRVLGRLDQVAAAYDFVVTPFVGVIPPSYEFHLNPAETDAVFSVPIASLLEPKSVAIADHLSSHGEPVYHFYCNGWDIWGATARIIVQFLATWFMGIRLSRPSGPSLGQSGR
jgi:hypothetical protein